MTYIQYIAQSCRKREKKQCPSTIQQVNSITQPLARPSHWVRYQICALCSVTSVDGLVPPTKRDTVLQDVTDRISEMGKYYGMEMNVEKTRVMGFSRQPTPVQMIIDKEQQQ